VEGQRGEERGAKGGTGRQAEWKRGGGAAPSASPPALPSPPKGIASPLAHALQLPLRRRPQAWLGQQGHSQILAGKAAMHALNGG
jgi:hypothetical protein